MDKEGHCVSKGAQDKGPLERVKNKSCGYSTIRGRESHHLARFYPLKTCLQCYLHWSEL